MASGWRFLSHELQLEPSENSWWCGTLRLGKELGVDLSVASQLIWNWTSSSYSSVLRAIWLLSTWEDGRERKKIMGIFLCSASCGRQTLMMSVESVRRCHLPVLKMLGARTRKALLLMRGGKRSRDFGQFMILIPITISAPFLNKSLFSISYSETKCIHNMPVFICLLSLAHPNCSVLGKEKRGICVSQYVIAFSTLTPEEMVFLLWIKTCVASCPAICVPPRIWFVGVVLKFSRIPKL